MGGRSAVPARAQFLHAAAGPGSTAARHLSRLAAAWRARRPGCRHPVRAAGLLRHPGLERGLCRLWTAALVDGRVLWAEVRGNRPGRGSAVARGEAGAEAADA